MGITNAICYVNKPRRPEANPINADKVVGPLSEELEDGLQKHWTDNSGQGCVESAIDIVYLLTSRYVRMASRPVTPYYTSNSRANDSTGLRWQGALSESNLA